MDAEGCSLNSSLRIRSACLAFFYATALCLGMYWLTGAIAINLYDEGYLWYGAIRTAAGDVPLRDFQSYDPARYYWSAAWSQIFGNGILALRLSNSIFQILGLTAGLLAARRITTHPLRLLAVGVVLLVWMYPRHKLFEPSLVMMNVYLVTRLIERPDARRHLMSGLMLGVTATFGRNHALYATLGQLAALVLVLLHARPARPTLHLLYWGGGVVLGYAPMLGLLLAEPGFAASFAQSLAQFGTMPKPVPWPWRILSLPVSSLPLFLVTWGISLTYVAMAIGYPLVLWTALRSGFGPSRNRALLCACACIGAGYGHHAINRADLPHLAQVVHPLLLGSLALPAALPWFNLRHRRAAVWAGVALLSIAASIAMHRFALDVLLASVQPSSRLTHYDVAGDELLLRKGVAQDFESVEEAVRSHVPEDAPLLIIPYRPIYYPLLGRKSPVWGILFLRAGQGESDEEIIRKLHEQGVDWALYTEERLVGVPDGFPKLRSRVWAYLQANFVPVDSGLPRDHLLLRRRTVPSATSSGAKGPSAQRSSSAVIRR
jgi:hypothetical protein